MAQQEAEAGAEQRSCLNYFTMKTSTLDKLCVFLAELLGTGILIFLGCMGCVNTPSFPNSHLQVILNFGLAVMVAIQCFGCVSGAHLNPAVTVAAYIYKMVTLQMAFVYFVAQLLGAFIGYGLLKLVLPADTISAGNGLCVSLPHPEITVLQGFAIEFIVTTVLIFVCCGVWDPRNAKFHDSVPLRFGLAIACLACTAGPYTGASMNPVRSFAPALWNGNFRNHWIYWLAPLSAAAVGALSFKAVFRREVVVAQSNDKLRAMEEMPLS